MSETGRRELQETGKYISAVETAVTQLQQTAAMHIHRPGAADHPLYKDSPRIQTSLGLLLIFKGGQST